MGILHNHKNTTIGRDYDPNASISLCDYDPFICLLSFLNDSIKTRWDKDSLVFRYFQRVNNRFDVLSRQSVKSIDIAEQWLAGDAGRRAEKLVAVPESLVAPAFPRP